MANKELKSLPGYGNNTYLKVENDQLVFDTELADGEFNLPFKAVPTILNPTLIATSGVINAAGFTDIYTVPTGKKFYFQVVTIASGASVVGQTGLFVKQGSYTMRIASNVNFSNTYSSFNLNASGVVILEAGDILSVNAPGAAGKFFLRGYEFSNSANVKTVKLMNVNTTNQILYTVPQGKTAYFITSLLSVGAQYNTVYLANATGTDSILNFYYIPSGGTFDASTLTTKATAINNVINNMPFIPVLLAGESIGVVSSSAAVGQGVFVSLIEK